MLTLPVPLGERSYEVLVGEPSIEELAARVVASCAKASGVALLADARVAKASPRVASLMAEISKRLERVHTLHLPPGEQCKKFSELEKTCEWLAEKGFDRRAVIVGIGGGATTDHAGFAAAIYLRGVDFVLLPTTLLSMVDASVGGKTAVDLRAGKNLVGAFHQPRLVAADLNFLDTLPAREQAAGMAEILKAGLIADVPLFERLESSATDIGGMSRKTVAEIVAAAIQVKIGVVSEDEKDNGRRAILNFGHTIGHAIEAASGYDLLHGEAVSLGMVAALSLGATLGINPPALVDRAVSVFSRFGLPTDVRNHVDDEVLDRIQVDKKRRANAIQFVFVPAVGQTVLRDVAIEELKTAIPAALARFA